MNTEHRLAETDRSAAERRGAGRETLNYYGRPSTADDAGAGHGSYDDVAICGSDSSGEHIPGEAIYTQCELILHARRQD